MTQNDDGVDGYFPKWSVRMWIIGLSIAFVFLSMHTCALIYKGIVMDDMIQSDLDAVRLESNTMSVYTQIELLVVRQLREEAIRHEQFVPHREKK